MKKSKHSVEQIDVNKNIIVETSDSVPDSEAVKAIDNQLNNEEEKQSDQPIIN